MPDKEQRKILTSLNHDEKDILRQLHEEGKGKAVALVPNCLIYADRLIKNKILIHSDEIIVSTHSSHTMPIGIWEYLDKNKNLFK